MRIRATHNACMFIGAWKAPPAVKRNTTYRVRVRYRTADIAGPRIAGQPFGFVAKTGDWLWGDGAMCDDPGVGLAVTPHQNNNTGGWQVLEGAISVGERDFLPNFYLVMENVSAGDAFVDRVWIEEDLGGGQYGPNIVSKPWMAHHQYMEQRNSFAFDQVVELAEQNGVFLRPVILEKNDRIFNKINYNGEPIAWDALCYDSNPSNDPDECPGNQWFYGNRRTMTKTRWLQQAWWRYLQARWGYSTSIHSWELLNEGDPWNELHYTLADELGAYMAQFAPNDHMVSTSTWHSFPAVEFWSNPTYPDVDFADVHLYVPESDANFDDAASATNSASAQFGAQRPGGAGKPVIRGETAFVVSGTEPPTSLFDQDTEGVWLHNFVWGGINPGGLLESYWNENIHIYGQNGDGSFRFDHRSHFGAYFNFIRDIPLNNGHYEDATAVSSNANIRVWGQKDPINARSHLWIQNRLHTWRNVIAGTAIPSQSASISVSGFQPGAGYTIEWWDTYETDPSLQIMRTDTVSASPDGSITFAVDTAADVAVKIYPQ